MITVGSLFSGIGGIDLGLERAGMTVIWQAEVDAYASRILAKHWPTVPNLGDVTMIDWSTVERPDLVCGGFPCQPVSLAGRGLAQLDPRWLWPAYAHCVRSLRPRYVLVENVPGLLLRGMGDVLGDLAALGYDTEWTGIPAAAVGAPQLRWRIFVVAHAQGQCDPQQPEGANPETLVGPGSRTGRRTEHGSPPERIRIMGRTPAGGETDAAEGDVANPDVPGRIERRRAKPVRAELRAPQCGREALADTKGLDCGSDGPLVPGDGFGHVAWPTGERWSWGSTGRGGEAGGTGWWAVEPELGRVAHGVPDRLDRLRCLGNAVVPQVAEYVGRRIVEAISVER